MSDFKSVMVAVGRSNPTGGNFFDKFIFPEFICLTNLLSDFLPELVIVKNPIKLIKCCVIAFTSKCNGTFTNFITRLQHWKCYINFPLFKQH